MMVIGDEAAPARAYPDDLQSTTHGRGHAGRSARHPPSQRAPLAGLRTAAFVKGCQFPVHRGLGLGWPVSLHSGRLRTAPLVTGLGCRKRHSASAP